MSNRGDGMDTMAWLTVAIVIATFAAPFLALHIQTKLEAHRRFVERKEWVFYSLMSNRNSQVHPDFVRALNSIDIAFNGGKHRSTTEASVIRAWRDLHHELCDGITANATAQMIETWNSRLADKVTSLLEAMSADLGYSFDHEFIRKGGYYTRGAAEHDNEMIGIRKELLKVLRREKAFPVENVQTGQDGSVAPLRFPGQLP